MWEDFLIAGAQVALVLGLLIPLKWKAHGALVALAIVHGTALMAIMVALYSVSLIWASSVTALEALLWFALAVRYSRQHEKG